MVTWFIEMYKPGMGSFWYDSGEATTLPAAIEARQASINAMSYHDRQRIRRIGIE
jgi:hypothetical protein